MAKSPAAPVRRSMAKPSSLSAASVHDNLTWLNETAVAARSRGASGSAKATSGVVTLTPFESSERPTSLNACIR